MLEGLRRSAASGCRLRRFLGRRFHDGRESFSLAAQRDALDVIEVNRVGLDLMVNEAVIHGQVGGAGAQYRLQGDALEGAVALLRPIDVEAEIVGFTGGRPGDSVGRPMYSR